MFFEQDRGLERIGKGVGFILGYALFTSVLALVLRLTGRLGSWEGALLVVAGTLALTLSGIGLQGWLK